jgi:cysteine desulfurase/selenocysteine lyase
MRRIYFDNAATSKPKPKNVLDAINGYLEDICTSPGRGGYALGLEAGRIIFETREKIKHLFNGQKEENVVFTQNVTYALNFALLGLLKPGDHAITTSMEHNSVIRPLRFLQKYKNVKFSIIKCNEKGELDPADIIREIRPSTKIIVLTHASNVTGTILPIESLPEIKNKTDAFMVLDAAQTAGVIDIDFEQLGLDCLGFTGHKSLYGPPGIGGLVMSDRACDAIVPTVLGGTGSRSDVEYQPDFMPDKMEAGTPNTAGIAGLSAGLDFIQKTGIKSIYKHEMKLTADFINGLKQIPRVKIYGPDQLDKRVSTVSITLDGFDMGELAFRLDTEYGIMIRSGLHCSPLGHKTIGTFPEGTLRFSFGFFNTEEEVKYCIEAIKNLVQEILQ